MLRGWNELVVEEVPRPVPAPGEVLVRVKACGLCGTDLKMVAGGFAGRWPPSFPFIMGHEWSGEVVEVGEGVNGLQVGDRVVAENHVGCARCTMCRSGRYNLCEEAGKPGYRLYGHTAPGALAEYATRPAQLLHPIPAHVSFEAGALVNQGALAVHATRRVGLTSGSSVAVFGPGLLGLLTAAVARASGATTVVVVGRGKRLRLAESMGSTHLVDYEKSDPVDEVRAATGGRGVDAVFDCSGSPQALSQALASVRRGGAVAVLGLTGGQTVPVDADRLTLDEIDLLGVRSSPNAYPAMVRLLASGRVDVQPLLTHTYPLERVGDALAALQSREAVRPIVTP